MLDRRITEFAHPDFVFHWKKLQHELWTTDLSSFSFDTCLIRKDGLNVWVHITTILIEDNGGMLGYTILEDISERKELERLREKVREQEHRQQIAETILNTQEDERKRVAEGLHNGLGQLLYGVKLSLNQIQANCEVSRQALQYAQHLLSDSIRECRRISHELMPAVLEEFGLKVAVQYICEQLSDAVEFNCDIKGFDKRLDKFLEVAVYRIVQELMMNVVKHSGASKANIVLAEERAAIHIDICDNGKGYYQAENGKLTEGIGLKTIKNKLAVLSGSLNTISENGSGLRIKITIPKRVD